MSYSTIVQPTKLRLGQIQAGGGGLEGVAVHACVHSVSPLEVVVEGFRARMGVKGNMICMV